MTWRYLAGDTSVFAIELSLVSDDVDDWMVDIEERSTWGTVAMWIGGANAFEYSLQGEQLRAAHWYLLPLVEWLVHRWDALLHEERLPAGVAAGSAAEGGVSASLIAERRSSADDDDTSLDEVQDWFERHRLRSAAPGALLPDLFVRRFGDLVEFSSTAAPPAGADWGGSFMTIPVVRVPVQAVASPLRDAVHAFAQVLADRNPHSERISTLQFEIAGLSSDERRESRFAWLSGAGAEHTAFRRLWSQVERTIRADVRLRFQTWSDPRDLAQRTCLRATPVSLLFGSVSPTVEPADLVAILQSLLDRTASDGTLQAVDALRDALETTSVGGPMTPGEFGTLCGEIVWSELEKRADAEQIGYVDVEALLSDIGIPIQDAHLSDTSLRAVTALTEDGAAAVVVNRGFRLGDAAPVRRFTLAHEFAHLILDRDRSVEMIVVSGPWAPRDVEQRANAFAAALLMPVSLLNRAMSDDWRTPGGLGRMASQLRVSYSALISRLQNVGYIGAEEAEYFRETAR